MKSDAGTSRLIEMSGHLENLLNAAGIVCVVEYDVETELLHVETEKGEFVINTLMSSSKAAVKDIFRQGLKFIDELIYRPFV